MSIPVKIEDLAKTLDDFDTAYLLTAGADGTVKVVCVEVDADGDSLRIPTGSKGASRNLAASSTATLMCPPRKAKGWTLIVDGTAESEGEGFRMSPRGAVLHRPASHSEAPVVDDGCASDCKPVG